MTNNGRRVVIFIGTKITKQKYNNLFLNNLHLLWWHANISKRDVTMKNKTNILNYWRVKLSHFITWLNVSCYKNFWRYTLHILVYAVKNNCDLMVWIFSTLYQWRYIKKKIHADYFMNRNMLIIITLRFIYKKCKKEATTKSAAIVM